VVCLGELVFLQERGARGIGDTISPIVLHGV
jgi:hypothetical protein